jgi:hypothetical protein
MLTSLISLHSDSDVEKSEEFEGLNGKSSILGLQCTEIFENRSKGSKVMTFFVDKK